jgi:hypothetical protein
MLGPDEELESFSPLSPQGPSLEERMNAMKVQRRELGMMFRQYIQDNFGIEWLVFISIKQIQNI